MIFNSFTKNIWNTIERFKQPVWIVKKIPHTSCTCVNHSTKQGGISVARNKDDIPFFVEDTLKAGQYKNDLQAVKVLTRESIENVDYLVRLGLDIDKDEDGNWDYTKEGAHCVNRIVHTQDNTGENVSKTLIKNALSRDNIRISEDTFLVDIIEKNNQHFQ